jgi:large subunit ribosomal protein L30
MADQTKRKIFVKWVRSGIAFPRRQKERVASLGLRRLNQIVACPDTPQVRGLVQRIHHLVEIVDEPKPPAWLSVPEYTILPQEVVSKPALKAHAPKAEASAAEEVPEVERDKAPAGRKHKAEAAAEPVKPKKAAKPAVAKHKAKAAKGEEEEKKRKAGAPKSHRPAKKTSKK